MTKYALYNAEHRTFLASWYMVGKHESFGWGNDSDFALTWGSMTEAMLFVETHGLTAMPMAVVR